MSATQSLASGPQSPTPCALTGWPPLAWLVIDGKHLAKPPKDWHPSMTQDAGAGTAYIEVLTCPLHRRQAQGRALSSSEGEAMCLWVPVRGHPRLAVFALTLALLTLGGGVSVVVRDPQVPGEHLSSPKVSPGVRLRGALAWWWVVKIPRASPFF